MINLGSLIFSLSMSWRGSLKKREGPRSPFGRVQPLLWSIKEKSCFKQRLTKILLTSLIKILFTDQPSSLGMNPQINTLILLDFLRKQELMLTIQLAIRRRICEIILGWFHIIEPHFSAAEVFVDSRLTRERFLVVLVQFLNLMPYIG